MEEENLVLNPNTANCFVIMIMICLYIHSRSLSSTTSMLNIIRGKFRSVAGLLLKFSIICAVCYHSSLFFLSLKYDIDKVVLELTHTLNKTYFTKINKHKVDLVYIMVSTLKISDALFVSCIFFCISLILSASYNVNSTASPLIKDIRYKICILTRLWGMFRLPLAFYSYYLDTFVNDKIYLFIRLIFGSIEFFIASIFILFSSFKNITHENSNLDPRFFTFTCFFYGFLKYTANLVDFPFKLTSTHIEILISIQFGLMCAIYLLLTEILFPKKSSKKNTKIITPSEPTNEIAMLETVIVFDEDKELIKSI